MRDRVAALMVRAATSGAIDYATADPYDKQWRIRHILILQEISRLDDEKIMLAAHQHWLAYVANGRLEPDSWEKMKANASNTLEGLQKTLFPWVQLEDRAQQNDTIEGKYGHLIAQYRAMVAQQKKEKQADNAGN